MKDKYMTVRLEPDLRKRVAEMARAERRRFSDQIIFLMEKGLTALEHQRPADRAPEQAGEASA